MTELEDTTDNAEIQPNPQTGEARDKIDQAISAIEPELETGDQTSQFSEEPQAEPAPSAKQPGILNRIITFLFNPETRFGRGMRAVTRTLAIIVGFFALGFLLAYLLLYRPTNQALESVVHQAQSLQKQLSDAQSALEITRNDLSRVQAQAEKRQTHIQVLSILDNALSVRLVLAEKTPGDPARRFLQNASEQLDQALPGIREVSPNTATALKARLDLIAGEISRDPRTAAADLDILIENLRALEQQLSQ